MSRMSFKTLIVSSFVFFCILSIWEIVMVHLQKFEWEKPEMREKEEEEKNEEIFVIRSGVLYK